MIELMISVKDPKKYNELLEPLQANSFVANIKCKLDLKGTINLYREYVKQYLHGINSDSNSEETSRFKHTILPFKAYWVREDYDVAFDGFKANISNAKHQITPLR